MSETPGCARRSAAISSLTLCAGIWPPSPGFDPCAILIWSSSANAAYSAVTPKRPEATCLIAELRSVRKRPASSPPSPEFERAPSRLSAIPIVSCASADSAPCDMAPPEKRRTTTPPPRLCPLERQGGAGLCELEEVARLQRRTPVDERREPVVEVGAPVAYRRTQRVGARDRGLQRVDDVCVGRMRLAALTELVVAGV